MPCLRKARRFGLCSPTCLCDVSEYLKLVDSRLFNRIQSPSHFLSHLLPPEKHHLGQRPRGHSYTLPISSSSSSTNFIATQVLKQNKTSGPLCPNKLCKSSFIPRCLFCFLWILTVFSITVFTVLFYYNIYVCHCRNKREFTEATA